MPSPRLSPRLRQRTLHGSAGVKDDESDGDRENGGNVIAPGGSRSRGNHSPVRGKEKDSRKGEPSEKTRPDTNAGGGTFFEHHSPVPQGSPSQGVPRNVPPTGREGLIPVSVSFESSPAVDRVHFEGRLQPFVKRAGMSGRGEAGSYVPKEQSVLKGAGGTNTPVADGGPRPWEARAHGGRIP